MTDHLITPPPQLVQAFLRSNPSTPAEMTYEQFIATRFARWGADQELEACCEWVEREIGHGREWGAELRRLRRPKPPSLKERALQAWAAVEAGTDDQTAMAVIRRALEALDD